MTKILKALLFLATIIAFEPAHAQSALHQQIIQKRAEFMAAEKAGDYRRSVEITRALLPLVARDRGKQSGFYAQAEQDHGMALHFAGRSREAVPFLKSAYNYMRARSSRNANTLAIMNNYVVVLTNAGELSQAASIGEDLLAIRETTLGGSHPETLLIKHNLASIYSDQGKPYKASGLLAAVLELRRKALGDDDPGTMTTMHNLAIEFSELKFYQEALDLFAEVVERRRRVLGTHHPNTLASITGYAGALVNTGKATEALQLLDGAIPALQSALGGNHPLTLAALKNKSDALSRLGRDDEAHRLLIALSAAHRNAPTNGSIAALNTNLSLAWSHYKRKEYDEALALFSSSQPRLFALLGRRHRLSYVATNGKAWTLRRLGKLVEAESAAEEALAIYRSYAEFSSPDSLKLIADIRLTNPERASQAIVPARELLGILREDRPSIGLGGADSARFEQNVTSDKRFYATILDALWSEQDRTGEPVLLTDEVFDAAQGMLATTASQAFARSAAAKLASRSGDRVTILVSALEEADKEWAKVQSNLVSASVNTATPSILSDIRQRKKANEANIARLVSQLEAIAPEYIELLRPKPLTIRGAQSFLKSDEVILLTLPTEHGVHVLGISKDKAEWFQSDLDPESLTQLVQRLLWDVGARVDVPIADTVEWAAEGEGAYPFDRGSAFDLYRHLLAPMADTLDGKRHIFVASTGSLSALPFGVMVTEPPIGQDGNPADLRATKWLADRFAMVRIPSVRSLSLLRMQAAVEGADKGTVFSGFGDPLLEGEATQRGVGKSERVRGGTGAVRAADIYGAGSAQAERGIVLPTLLKKLARLPGTAIELKAMQAAFDAPAESLHLGAAASEQAIRQADLSGVDVLAIATHGLLAGEIAGAVEPGLVMTPADSASGAFDGYLSASEIASLDLSADWVVLSACNTAAGDGSEGATGLSGLAKAFFLAGAENLLASHWPIRDDVAPILTVRMIELARSNPGISRAEALQRAMQEVRNNAAHDSEDDTWAHPSAWAPFSLVGDAGI